MASYRASYTLDGVVSVAASDATGRITYWSNYGATSVDLAAPGKDIYSTTLGGADATESGTSMAAPFVTGAIALMISQNPSLTAAEIKSRLMTGADEQASQSNETATDGTLNVANAVQAVAGERVADPTDAADPTTPGQPAYPLPAYALPWFGYGIGFGQVPVSYGSAQSWSVVAATDGYGWRFTG